MNDYLEGGSEEFSSVGDGGGGVKNFSSEADGRSRSWWHGALDTQSKTRPFKAIDQAFFPYHMIPPRTHSPSRSTRSICERAMLSAHLFTKRAE